VRSTEVIAMARMVTAAQAKAELAACIRTVERGKR